MQLAPAPRHVSLPMRLQVLLGGILGPIGWGLFAFGLIFFWVFAADTLINTVRFQGELKSTSGIIRSASPTNMRINKVRVIAHEVDFQVDGKALHTVGYTTGNIVQAGTPVTVLYKAEQPDIARVEGMRAAAFEGLPALLILILPAIALIMILLQFFKGWQTMGLLANGKLTKARLIARAPTNARVNGQTVWKLTFVYQVQGQNYEHIFQSHKIAGLVDEAEEALIYSPDHPRLSRLLDGLPGGIRLDSHGQFSLPNPGSLLLALFPPALAVSVFLIGWTIKF